MGKYSKIVSVKLLVGIMIITVISFVYICTLSPSSEIYLMICSLVFGKRTFYNIAHMINSLEQMDLFLDRGANAFECDLNFDSDGTPKYMNHGSPSEDGREGKNKTDAKEYLNHLRLLSNTSSSFYRKEFCLLYFDLKLYPVKDFERAGRETAKLLVDHYWTRDSGPGYVILSIPFTKQASFIDGFNNYLVQTELIDQYADRYGWDFVGNEDLETIARTYKNHRISNNIWQGDGTWGYKFRNDIRLRKCIRARNSKTDFIQKTYSWTLDHTSKIENALRLGVDGILSNMPEVVLKVLNSTEFSNRFRLAVPNDNPFEKIPDTYRCL